MIINTNPVTDIEIVTESYNLETSDSEDKLETLNFDPNLPSDLSKVFVSAEALNAFGTYDITNPTYYDNEDFLSDISFTKKIKKNKLSFNKKNFSELILKTSPGQIISLVPTNLDTKIKTNGLQYALNKEKLSSPTQGISNVAKTTTCTIEATDWTWVILNHNQ